MRFLRGFGAACLIGISGLALLLWGRSCYIADTFSRGSDARYLALTSAAGSFIFTTAIPTRGEAADAVRAWRYQDSHEPRNVLRAVDFTDTVWNRLGFARTAQNVIFPHHMKIHHTAIPHWFILLFTVPMALRWLTRAEGPEEDPLLECPRCGQMFTVLPMDCPVCGHRLQESAAQGAPDT